MPPTVTYRGSRDGLTRLLRLIPAVLAGRAPDPAGIARGIALRLANVALSKVQQEFVILSRGGSAPSDGRKWAALAPSTIRHRLAKAPRSKKGTAVYAQVDILRDTSAMFRSLTPGVEDRPSGQPDQVIRLGKGEIYVGTNDPKAAYHQHGTERMPARPIVPPSGRIPAAWWPAIVAALARGFLAAVTYLARAGR